MSMGKLFAVYPWLSVVLVANTPLPAQLLASGTFAPADAGIQVAGGFEVLSTGSGRTLELSQDFAVSSGPDLYFTFSPLEVEVLTSANAKQGAYQVQPKLKSTSGAQSYSLGEELDLSAHTSLTIHCWQFSHLYAVAELKLETPSGPRFRAPQASDEALGRLPIVRLSQGWILSPSARDLAGRFRGGESPIILPYR